jgi:hypothetical protein
LGAALFCLLFQQLAMAGYVCPQQAMPSHLGSVIDCAAMGMATSDQSPAHPADPRCGEHCASHVPTTAARMPAPLLLPLAYVPFVRVVLLAAPSNIPLLAPGPHPPDPPLSLRFCSLLI